MEYQHETHDENRKQPENSCLTTNNLFSAVFILSIKKHTAVEETNQSGIHEQRNTEEATQIDLGLDLKARKTQKPQNTKPDFYTKN